MSCGTSGCCLGLILGFITAIVLAVAAAFGIYCYFTPGAREQGREIIERKWNDIKSGGDKLIEKTGPAEPVVEPPLPDKSAAVTEPEI